jgi:hypothetical protein
MRRTAFLIFLGLGLMLVPSVALAQSSITGVVRDTSGAVLPGVTVEAASDALIEKVRTAVTDGSGSYRIVDLRPGVYSVTFTLTGFSTYKREGLELASEFNATVNADLRVGALEETITVTGESPIVDVTSARRQRTLDSDLVQALPTTKGYAGLMVLIPSMMQSGGGVLNVQLSPGLVVFGGRCGRGNEGRAQVDGLNTGASLNGGGVSGYRQDVENAQEVQSRPRVGSVKPKLADRRSISCRVQAATRSGLITSSAACAAACRRATSPKNFSRRDSARQRRRTTCTTPAIRSVVRSSGTRSGSTSSPTTAVVRTRSPACFTTGTSGIRPSGAT